MGFSITLQPSGRSFNAEPQETLLEAALRSGINIPYNCNSGSCGVCKAQVVCGEVDEQLFHDYKFTAAEQGRHTVLLCNVKPRSDLVLAVNEIGDARQIARQQIQTRVAKIERIGERHINLTLRTPRSQTLQFMAGQHVELSLISNGLICDAAVASCPCSSMYLQFHFARRTEDPFSMYVFEALQVNDVVRVDGPFGSFSLNEISTRPIVLVAHGSGFAPIKSLIEHAIALELPQPLLLYWFSSFEDGFYMGNLCRSWVDALDNFRYQPLYLENGREHAAAEVLAADIVQAQDCDYYMAANAELLAALHQALLGRGVPNEQIHMMEKRQCARI